MQHISTSSDPNTHSYGVGGRVSSHKLRSSLQLADDFLGLEEDTNRYDLLLLVKKIGKSAGFTSRMIELLDYYMAFTRDIDWEEGSSPIVYQSLSKTALDLGLSERQIQNIEKQLFEMGALTWNDSGNHRRYGQRCTETGEIIYAYGVDLTPLAYIKEELATKLARKQERDRAWMQLKRDISVYRRRIRAMMGEIEEEEGSAATLYSFDKAYKAIAKQIRTHMSIEQLESLKAEHKVLLNAVEQEVQPVIKEEITQKISSKSAKNCTHNNNTIQKKSNKLDSNRTCFQGKRNENLVSYRDKTAKKDNYAIEGVIKTSLRPSLDPESILERSGLRHITLQSAVDAASDRFKAQFQKDYGNGWPEFIDAAYRLKSELGISQNSWVHACQVLGRSGAAICVLLVDRATLRIDNPVRKPAGYFNAMIDRASAGALHLHKSIFGLISKSAKQ